MLEQSEQSTTAIGMHQQPKAMGADLAVLCRRQRWLLQQRQQLDDCGRRRMGRIVAEALAQAGHPAMPIGNIGAERSRP